ncbi:MAG: T9SS type A sorting domain-containing protein [Chitinophagales bacterium]
MRTTITLFMLLFTFTFSTAQTLPIDFETAITTSNFIDFDGGTASVIDNPQQNGINTSNKVAQIVRNGGQIWSGSKIELAANLDFSSSTAISMKVYTTAPIGTTVKFKLEGAGETERDVQTTVSNEWEVLTWDFSGEPTNFNAIVFMFDFGNIGDGSETSTFLFDDIEQLYTGTPIDLPVDFESTGVNYTMTDFGGNVSSLVADPNNANNTVIQVIKTNGAATWAGTTIGTPAGFATDIPLTLSTSKMTIKVWSPEAGTPIRLKVEDSNDPTHTCETQTNTTVAGAWETLEFDFSNQASGTESLSVGLSMGWTYNMASIFFNFDTDGATAGEKTYYFDDVAFGELMIGMETPKEIEGLKILSNPSNDNWTISAANTNITLIEMFDLQGKRLLTFTPNSHLAKIDASKFANGIYIAAISTNEGTSIVQLLRN